MTLDLTPDELLTTTIPYERCTQAALLPVAYSLGADFEPARRREADTVVHWDRW